MAARKKAWIVITLLIIVVALAALFFIKQGASKPEKEEPVTEQTVQPKVEAEPEIEKTPEPEPKPEPEPEPEPTPEPQPEPEPEPEPQPQPEPEPEIQIRVPEAPDLDWMVITEEYEEPSLNLYQEDENVDWSEFVFSDQEIVLPDGTYYATLYVNDSVFGTIEFQQLASEPHFLKRDLQAQLNGTLSETAYEQLFSNPDIYYSLPYLETFAQSLTYNSTDLILKLYFNSSQVPVQTISMSSSGYSSLRQNYDVVGNVTVEPAHFSFVSNMSLFMSMMYDLDSEFSWNNLSATLSLANTFSFWNTTFSMPASLTYVNSRGVIPSVGSWNAYIDFPNQNIRFSFGNVGNAGFSNGSPVGFTVEKNYGFGTGSAMSNQFAQTITLTEDSTVDITVNGNSVFNRTLSLGIYRLTDFAFVQGSNDVVVTIHPLSRGEDTSEDKIIRFGQNYDTSLMAKGETTWRTGISIPKINQKLGTGGNYPYGFIIPALPTYSSSDGWTGMENVYNLSAISIFWEQSIGLTHTYTQSHTFSFVYEKDDNADHVQSLLFGGTVSGIIATSLGTSRVTLNGSFSNTNASRTSLSLVFSQAFISEILKPLSFSCSYSFTPDVQMTSLNLGYSFNIKGVRIGLSASSSYKFPSVSSSTSLTDPLTINAALSVGTNLGKNGSFSLNASINQSMNVYATASLSFSYSGQSLSSSVSTSQLKTLVGNISWSFRPSSTSRSSFQLNASNIDLMNLNFQEIPSHTLSGAWARSGDIVSMSFRAQASNKYRRFTSSLSLNSSLVFADGYFSMANSVYGPFLIVAPSKGLKNATIAVSNATESSTGSSKKVFGNVLYTRLSMYKPNNIIVYASNGSLFTSSGSFLFKITPVARQGFLAKISLESTVAISGILRQDPVTPYDSYSSPIYSVQLDDNGVDVKSMEIESSSYFFTDLDGRFIISDLKSGIYMIDLNINGQWYAAFFEVPVVESPGYVAILKDFDASTVDLQAQTMQKYNVKSFDQSYAGSLYIDFDRYITEDEYWSMLFTLSDEAEDSWYDFDEFDEYDESLYKDISAEGR